MTKPFRLLSWGCGVQSTTLAVMSALGDLDRLDAVIHADTQWERRDTIKSRDFYIGWLRDKGIRVEIVTGGNIRELGAVEHIHIPFWTDDGGPLQRQCTRNFKIVPVKHKIRELLGYHPSRPPAPPPGSVEQWLGFSLDEWSRMKDSRVAYIVNRHPLIEKGMTRSDCVDYLTKNGLPVPGKSACIGCPYRTAAEWLDMRDNSPEEWKEAIEFDETNRSNPLAKRGASTADNLYIYKYGGALKDANLDADAKAEEGRKKTKQLPLVCNGASCWT